MPRCWAPLTARPCWQCLGTELSPWSDSIKRGPLCRGQLLCFMNQLDQCKSSLLGTSLSLRPELLLPISLTLGSKLPNTLFQVRKALKNQPLPLAKWWRPRSMTWDASSATRPPKRFMSSKALDRVSDSGYPTCLVHVWSRYGPSAL